MALLGGADDVGSTMMEENVVLASGTEDFALESAQGRQTRWIQTRRDSDYNLLDTLLFHRMLGLSCTSSYAALIGVYMRRRATVPAE